jgi:putative endonuclease
VAPAVALSPAMRGRHARGVYAERAARAFLEERGLAFVAANVRTRAGELDLVMRDGTLLVIAEVRARASSAYGGAAASVDARKQRRIIAATGLMLRIRPALATLRLRFDVLAISGVVGDTYAGGFRIEWIRDAFRA